MGRKDPLQGINKLKEKIEKDFDGEILINKGSKKFGNVVYCKQLAKDKAIKSVLLYSKSFEYKVTQAAQHLRGTILDLKKKLDTSAGPLTPEELSKGEADPPDILVQFF